MVNGDDMSFSAENVTFETPSEAASTNNIALYINGAWNESGLTQSSGVNVSLTNFTYEDDSAHSGLYFQNYSDIDLSVQQSSLTVDKYAINIQANTAASIDISGCEIQGWTAYYAYSCNTNTTITDSILIGINHFSGPSNNFRNHRTGRRRTSGYPGRGLRLWEHAVHHGQRYPGQYNCRKLSGDCFLQLWRFSQQNCLF